MAKLERNRISGVTPVMERFAAALEESAQRLMGASYESVKHDSAKEDQITKDVVDGFCCRLNRADWDRLVAELEQIAGVRMADLPDGLNIDALR